MSFEGREGGGREVEKLVSSLFFPAASAYPRRSSSFLTFELPSSRQRYMAASFSEVSETLQHVWRAGERAEPKSTLPSLSPWTSSPSRAQSLPERNLIFTIGQRNEASHVRSKVGQKEARLAAR